MLKFVPQVGIMLDDPVRGTQWDLYTDSRVPAWHDKQHTHVDILTCLRLQGQR